MWCKQCQQDVPAMAAADLKLVCSRCRGQLVPHGDDRSTGRDAASNHPVPSHRFADIWSAPTTEGSCRSALPAGNDDDSIVLETDPELPRILDHSDSSVAWALAGLSLGESVVMRASNGLRWRVDTQKQPQASSPAPRAAPTELEHRPAEPQARDTLPRRPLPAWNSRGRRSYVDMPHIAGRTPKPPYTPRRTWRTWYAFFFGMNVLLCGACLFVAADWIADPMAARESLARIGFPLFVVGQTLVLGCLAVGLYQLQRHAARMTAAMRVVTQQYHAIVAERVPREPVHALSGETTGAQPTPMHDDSSDPPELDRRATQATAAESRPDTDHPPVTLAALWRQLPDDEPLD